MLYLAAKPAKATKAAKPAKPAKPAEPAKPAKRGEKVGGRRIRSAMAWVSFEADSDKKCLQADRFRDVRKSV